MARARPGTEKHQSLYEQDFSLWLEEQAALLREGRFDELDLVNLVEEIEAIARKDKKAIKSNLVVLLSTLHRTVRERSSRAPTSTRKAWRERELDPLVQNGWEEIQAKGMPLCRLSRANGVSCPADGPVSVRRRPVGS